MKTMNRIMTGVRVVGYLCSLVWFVSASIAHEPVQMAVAFALGLGQLVAMMLP